MALSDSSGGGCRLNNHCAALYMAGNEFMTLTAVCKYLTMLAFIAAICGTFAMEIDREKKDETNHEEGLR